MSFQDTILSELKESRELLDKFLSDSIQTNQIEQAALTMITALKNGGKIISCGNGGSMSDAMHFAEELTGRYRENRVGLPAISISDPTHITCTANDFGFEYIFSRYVESLGKQGDVLLAISTSGNSSNVLKAAEVARKKGMSVVGLTGKDGGKLASLCDVEIRVPHFGFADRIQEIHIKVIHILILLIEKGVIAAC
ncbi:MAG: D-sedoheptulose 7-phosphate isomerase [Cyclobacteriaceae bacterium]|nr:D-sedoheptulose 7-phosphate isomerase [Cyclobacteriaceae bacterium]